MKMYRSRTCTFRNFILSAVEIKTDSVFTRMREYANTIFHIIASITSISLLFYIYIFLFARSVRALQWEILACVLHGEDGSIYKCVHACTR